MRRMQLSNCEYMEDYTQCNQSLHKRNCWLNRYFFRRLCDDPTESLLQNLGKFLYFSNNYLCWELSQDDRGHKADTNFLNYRLGATKLALGVCLLIEARQPHHSVWGPPGATKSQIAQQVAQRPRRLNRDDGITKPVQDLTAVHS